MIDAPLEKILEDDCQAQAMDLLHQINLATVMPEPLEVAAVIRMIAVGLDLPPPTGAALRIRIRGYTAVVAARRQTARTCG